MAERLWRTGNPKSMRIGSGPVRLRADPTFGWNAIVARANTEKDDLSMAQLVRALCLIATQDPADTQPHMRWLLRFAKDRGPSTREAVLALYGEISENHAKIASGAIEELFDLRSRNQHTGA
jgi:hypothetical protein